MMRVAVTLSVSLTVFGLVACQQEHTGDAAADLQRARNLRAELAGSNLNSSAQAIVSNLEVPAAGELSNAGVAVTSDPAVAAPNVQPHSPSGARRIGTVRVPAAVLSVPSITEPVAVVSLPRDLPSPLQLPSPALSVGAGDGASGDTGETNTAGGDRIDTPARPSPAPPRIVIRGGDARPHDPCALHGPRPASVMINNRIPMRNPGGVRLPR